MCTFSLVRQRLKTHADSLPGEVSKALQPDHLQAAKDLKTLNTFALQAEDKQSIPALWLCA
jgi:hypothetical protein